MRKFVSRLFFLFLFVSAPLCAAQPPESGDPASQDSSKLIKSIIVTGNKAISTETIMAKIKTRVGQPYYAQASRDDIKRLYEMGFFSDISLDLEDEDGGLKVIFRVVERPVIQEIAFAGQKVLTRRFFISKMKTKEGQYLSLATLKEDIAMIKNEYEKRGLPQADVAYEETADPDTGKVKLLVTIKEGERVIIKKLYIDGNLNFKDGKILSLIKTRQKKFLNPGAFKEEQVADDLERIKGFYLKNGYLDVKADYRIDYDAEGKMVLRVVIEEGRQYSVGAVVIEGNEVFSKDEVAGSLKSCLEGEVFTYDALREDVANIQGFYFGKGYIFVQVEETTSLDPETGKVDVAYAIVENDEVYVDRIDIRGNLKTRDKVIRRELRIKPGEKFDGDKLKRSKERLYNLGFFEEVNYDTEPGSAPDKRNLVVDVKEAKTGSLSFGGGYSSIDQLVGFVEIEQKNFDWRNWKTFTGGGQSLKLRAEMGQVRQDFDLSFTEPWWLDHPVSFGFDVYKRTHEKEADVGYGYREERTGGDLRLAKEFTEYIKGGTTYRLEMVDISDVEAAATADLRAEEGKNWISSVEFALTRDTTDNIFNPSRGLVLSGTYEVAGGPFGGDKDFNKLFTLATQYIPVFGKSVLQLQARAGIAQAYGNSGTVPIYERFFAGGANTIRGYEERGVGPIDPATDDPIGGESIFVANVEYTVPLMEFLKGAIFIDTGNVWSKTSDLLSGGLKTGIGFGVRVKTPIGPLKLDYGIPVEEQPGKEGREGRFHFSMSHGF